MKLRRFGLAALYLSFSLVAHTETLHQLSESFWTWRALEQPFSEDDIPRIERPDGFVIDWSLPAVEKRRKALAEFQERWQRLKPAQEQVDYRLIGSALARVHWELNIEQAWRRNPEFYVDQTLGSMYVLLLPPPPFQPERQRELIRRLQSIPATVRAAKENLTGMRRPFAQLAISALRNVAARLLDTQTALAPQLTEANNAAFGKAAAAAAAALDSYRKWLEEKLPGMRDETAIGRDNYVYFLREVALLPYTPEEMLSLSRQEWSRAVAFESYEQARNSKLPPLPLFADQSAQMAAEAEREREIRGMLAEQHLLTIPAWLKHYRNLPLPPYLVPFEGLSVTDDLTGPSRLDQDGISYILEPNPSLGFFHLSTARDPRPIIVHEGIPGHYFQLCLGWANADPIRRHYYDSGANEGIGFYAEEMMLQAGLFDDSPRSREIIYSFMRLRALRVEVDVKLALGTFTLQQAAGYLAQTVPMDQQTALSEAAMFASSPGQAISYQMGKIQIMQMLADARRLQGKDFSLLRFNDFLWNNGNVPIALQRWEMLGDKQ